MKGPKIPTGHGGGGGGEDKGWVGVSYFNSLGSLPAPVLYVSGPTLKLITLFNEVPY